MSAPLSLRAALVASLVAAGFLLAVPPASAVPKCFGKTATIVGTGGKDELIGTKGADVIVGLGGADFIDGRGGDDRLCGGNGDDDIGGAGGRDKMNGGPANDFMGGQGGKDWVFGGSGVDFLFGGPDADIVKGEKGSDLLHGNQRNDTLRGGPSADLLRGQNGNDTLDGGTGFDVASFFFSGNHGGIEASLLAGTAQGEGSDKLEAIEGLEASGQVSAPDEFIGDARGNLFFPYKGADVVDGGAKDDRVSFYAADNPVQVDLGLGTASGEGDDVLTSIEEAVGSRFGDSLTGSAEINLLFGLAGGDSLFGLAGGDFLHGGGGSDDGDGGDGDDECVSIENPVSCETTSRPSALFLRPGSVVAGVASVFGPAGVASYAPRARTEE